MLGVEIASVLAATQLYSAYPFLLPFLGIYAALLALTLHAGWHRTNRRLAAAALLIGLFAAFFYNLRTTYLPVVVCGYAWQDVQAGLQLMTDHQIRRLPIVNNADQLIGIVSLGDLAKVMPNKQLLSEALERISEARRLEPVAS